MSKLGCSSRIVVFLGVLFLALTLAGFILGPIGSSLFKIQAPKELQISSPHVALPSEIMFIVDSHGIQYAADRELKGLKPGEFPITNTLMSSWITMLLLILFFVFATRKMLVIPGKLQSLAEVVVDGIYNTIGGVVGEKYTRTFFPLVTTIFLYVVANALLALIPIWGTWGPVHEITEGSHHATVTIPFLRAANTDVNLTLSIALISFCFIEFLGFTRIGPIKYIDSFFQFGALGKAFGELFKGNFKAFMSGLGFGFINIYVGLLEILSHFIRIVSFTFRLFGNMTAGEILLGVMTFLVAFIVPVIFYGLETLVGFLQGMIFAGLTLVFGLMAVTSHHEEGAEHN